MATDSANHVGEHGFEDNNHDYDTSPLAINLTPPPDLEVTALGASQLTFSGPTMSVDWTVMNLGGSPTEVSWWQDAVYLSVDASFETAGDNTLIGGPYRHTGMLDPDEFYDESRVVNLPNCIDNTYHVFVVTDVADQVEEFFPAYEDNNDDAFEVLTIITEEPDLEVTLVDAPADGFSSQSIDVSWEIYNAGAGDTLAGSFVDRVYLSFDEILDVQEDTPLGTFTYQGILPAAGGYFETQSVTLPSGISGAFFIFVVTDADGDLIECGATANNIGHDPVALQVEFTEADLQVSNVVPDSEGFSSQPISVEWTVVNDGDRATDASAWADAVYLSRDNVLDTPADISLGTFAHAGALGATESYTSTEPVVLPPGAEGLYYVLVCTDVQDVVLEPGKEDNNCTASIATVNVTFSEPDLQVELVDASTTGLSGQPISVEWTVVNAGDRATDQAEWSDAVYLSEDDTLDASRDMRLADFVHTGVIGATETYNRIESVTLPPAVAGTYHVFVCADADDEVVEPNQESNNCSASPTTLEVTAFEPDLQTFGVAAPDTGLSGSPIDVDWNVQNTGERATTEEAWTDRVYLSPDQTLGSDDTLLATIARDGGLNVDESYQMSELVTLSAGRAGPHYILVKTDAENQVYELGREANNVASSPTTIDVICVEADLQVTSVSAPNLADSGLPLEVSWTVTNAGDRATEGNTWLDAVYLSDDPDLDMENDSLLGEYSWNDPLGIDAGNNSYTRNASVALPDVLEGVHYLFVVTDITDRVEECDDEHNNANETPTAVTVSLTIVDLQVESVEIEAGGYAGQETSPSWTVINAGDSVTPNDSWWDAVYLSLDLILDPLTDPFLGFAVHTDQLGPGIKYESNEAFMIPPSIPSGNYFVLVWTDNADVVYEHEGEDNNGGASLAAMFIEEPLEADLVVTDVVAPFSASPGQLASFGWTVVNQGANDAVGSWYDSVYLSTDETWDLHDVLVTKVRHEGTVPAGGGSYAQGRLELVPGALPGAQYVIVRCDIHNHIPEGDPGEGNNLGVSTGTTDIQIVELTLGEPFEAEFIASGAPYYFQVNVGADETLRVTLDAESTTGANELYIRYDQLPDRGHYDDAHDNPFVPDQDVTVPTTRAGTYYILVYGDWVPSPPEPFTLLAESLPFSVTEVDPDFGSNTAAVTIEIIGARFAEETEFSLVTIDDVEIAPDIVYPQDQAKAFATFDLDGTAHGLADVVAVNPDQVETTTDDLFEVLGGGGAQLSARVIAPSSVREGRPFMMRVEYGNIGTSDMPAPLLELRASRVLMLALHPDGPYYESPIRILGVNFDGPAGVLPPGEYGALPIYVGGTTGGGSIRIGVIRVSGNERIDWQAEEKSVHPDGVSEYLWDIVWAALVEHVGQTWRDYEQAMANMATRLWLGGQRVHDMHVLFDHELEFAWEAYTSRISGTVLDTGTEEPVEGALVVARSDDGVVIEHATTDAEGAFEHRVSPGLYTLFVEGYFLEPATTVDVAADEDMLGLMLYAEPLPGLDPPYEEPTPPDTSPSMATDAAGNAHLVFKRGEQTYHAVHHGTDWQITGEIAITSAGDPQVVAGPSGAGTDSVTIVWQDGFDNEADLYYSVGSPTRSASDYNWTSPGSLTDDAYYDTQPDAAYVIGDELITVWLKKDADITDDTDVYWAVKTVSGYSAAISPTRTEKFTRIPEPRRLAVDSYGPVAVLDQPVDLDITWRDAPSDRQIRYSKSVSLAKGTNLPSWVPVIGGKYAYEVTGEISGELGCTPNIGGSIGVGVDFSKNLHGDGNVGASAHWKTDKKRCEYVFDNAKFTLGASATNTFPPVIYGIPGAVVNVGGTLTGGLQGTIEWKAANFPGWPSGGNVDLTLGGSIWGEASVAWFTIGKVTGTVRATGRYAPPADFTIPKYCAKVQLESEVGSYFFKMPCWEYGTCRDYGIQCPGPSARLLDDPRTVRTSRTYMRDGVPVYYVNTLVIDPWDGTGSLYPGSTVLADVSTDVRNDGAPSIAVVSAAETLAAWTKDSPDPNTALGMSLVVATFDGTQWGAPVEVDSAAQFNSDPHMIVDAAGTPLLLWSRASAKGVSLDDTAEDILNAMDNTDIHFAVRNAGIWSAPMPLAELTGTDRELCAAASGANEAIAAWLNIINEEAVVYASVWNGTNWSAAMQVSDAAGCMAVSCAYVQGVPMIVWEEDDDGDSVTGLDRTLYHATFDGASWSAPVALPREQPERRLKSVDRAAGRSFSLGSPPAECCGECGTDGDCNDGLVCTEDKCVNALCQHIVRNERCDDGEFCNGTEKCDPVEDCVILPPPCAEEDCNEDADSCTCLVDSQCDDGNPCNGEETCEWEEAICRPGEPLDCGEGDECLRVWCDPEVGCRSESLDCGYGPFVRVVASSDPNEKIGPDGYGEDRWVTGDKTLFYTILFENLPDATAAAQVVSITDQLSEGLDWRTFRVQNLGWSGRVVELPGNRSFYQGEVDLRDELGLLVRIDVGVNVQTGLAGWTLSAIDP
ncbi:MAG: CARDB domain-containing protein, partial [Planctomycetota bacterium]